MMKTAQELRVGNVVLIKDQPLVIQKLEASRSGRNSAVFKMRFKNLLNDTGSEGAFKGEDKFEVIILEHLDCTYSYFADPMYVFMDGDYNQHEVERDNMGDALNYLEDGMECSVVLYDGKPISVEMPTTIVREIIYTEPAARGDTTGKVTKMARLSSGMELQVAAFCEVGDKIEIDTRTNEFRKRAN